MELPEPGVCGVDGSSADGCYGRTYDVFGMTYKFYTNAFINPEFESIFNHNNFIFYSAAGIKRLLASDGDERVTVGEYGTEITGMIAFYAHPEARSAMSEFQEHVFELLGGVASEYSSAYSMNHTSTPQDRRIKLTEALEAIDKVLLEEQFADLAQIVEDLRPRSKR